MTTVLLPDGYNGDFIECEAIPILVDGDLYKLRVFGSSYLFRWCTKDVYATALQGAKE